MISSQRISRLAEIEQSSTNAVYSPTKLFTDLRDGLFRELNAKPVDIDLYRRNLQRSYIDMLAANLKTPAVNSDLPAYSRAELEAIRTLIQKSAQSSKPVVQMHLKDLTARITPRPRSPSACRPASRKVETENVNSVISNISGETLSNLRLSIKHLGLRQDSGSPAVASVVFEGATIQQVHRPLQHIFQLMLHVNAVQKTPMDLRNVAGDEIDVAVAPEIVAQYGAKQF